MSTEQEEADEFFDNYRRHMHQIDDIVHVVLNTHLDVEQTLDSFLGVVFFHPEYIQNCNLQFYQRVHIARAYSELLHDRPEWPLMLALGSLRNAIAHGDKGKKRADKIAELRGKMSGLGSTKSRKRVKAGDDREAVIYAGAICSGFKRVIEVACEFVIE